MQCINVMEKLKTIWVSLLLILMLGPKVEAVESNQATTLLLDCIVVPSVKDQLCYATTNSAFGPYEDVVFFRKTAEGELYFLGSDKNGVANFGGAGFSDGGKYMWLEWSEEGHPLFSFYITDFFLSDGLDAPAIATLDAYGFHEFIRFGDDGTVLYTKEQVNEDTCHKTPCTYTFSLRKEKAE